MDPARVEGRTTVGANMVVRNDARKHRDTKRDERNAAILETAEATRRVPSGLGSDVLLYLVEQSTDPGVRKASFDRLMNSGATKELQVLAKGSTPYARSAAAEIARTPHF